jgi:hypothetical protein
MRIATIAVLLFLSGCATLQQVMALRDVDFTLDRVADVRLAGVDMSRVQTFGDLSVGDAGRIAIAASRRELPLEFQLHLLAENPEENSVSARLVQMDWTLLLQDRETLSGTFANETVLPPGQPVDVPIGISLNLIEFFEGNAEDLVELALSLAGQGGEPKDIALRATPIVQTSLGPIRYPNPITIVSGRVGG